MAKNTEWSFVNVANPADLKKAATKKAVRSYTTRRQHEKSRLEHAEIRKRRRTEPSFATRVHPSVTPPRQPSPSIGSDDGAANYPTPSSATPSRESSPAISAKYGSARYPTPPNDQLHCKSVAPTGRRKSQWTMYAPLYDNAHFMPGATNYDPFSLCPVPYKPWFASVLDHWHSRIMPLVAQVMCIEWDLENFKAETQGLMWSDAALFYVGILASTGIPVKCGFFPLDKALWVREKAIKALNEALADPNSARIVSTPVILAIGLLAYHEHRHGDKALARDGHRPVQRQLIKMRGRPLDISSSHLKIHLGMDTLMANETNTPKYFAEAFETICPSTKPVSTEDLKQVDNTLYKQIPPDPNYDSSYDLGSLRKSPQLTDNDDDGNGVKRQTPPSPSMASRWRELVLN